MASTSQLETDKPFKCEACSRGFQKQKGLSVHRKKCKEVESNQKAIESTSISSSTKRPRKKARVEHNDTPVEPSTAAAGKQRAREPIAPEIMIVADLEPEAIMLSPNNESPFTFPEEAPFPPETQQVENAPDYFVPPPTRRGRERKFPKRFDDFLPCTRTRIPHLPPPPVAPPPPPPQPAREPTPAPLPPSPSKVGSFTTEINEFGMYRVYPTFPTREIDENEELANVCEGPGLAQPASPPISQWFRSSGLKDPRQHDTHGKGIWAPFLNATVYKLFRWFYTGGSTKSVGEFQRLIDDVLDQPDYNPADVHGLKVTTVLASLDSQDPTVSPFALENGWKKSTVTLPLPCEKVTHTSESHCPTLEIPNVYHRPLLDTIKSAFTDESSLQFHYTPFKQFWKPTTDSPPERVITELYNSDAFYEEHLKIVQEQSQIPSTQDKPHYETAIAAIMLWSDSTHLANFGNASLWPIYLYLGNLSKYTRGKPTSSSAHHVAYIPSLPSNLQDIYMKAFNNISASKDTISHLKRELMHAIWLLMLDPEFMKAYEHGFLMQCSDGIWRHIFPRFFTYSADYPEKVLLATIKYLAKCPCPRCTTQKKFIPALGTHVDSQRRSHKRVDNKYRQFDIEVARKDIYQDGKGAKSTAVDNKLGDDSSIPVRNAFSTRLFKYGFNFFDMFVPDLLHEFELGVWKAVFTHLMRILYATGDVNAIQILNKRYRNTPTFGETIRRFSNNAAAMTKLAARDFEDLLQCALPVFESFLPERHNKVVLNLLFTLCTWHALAKLRLHTSSTIAALKTQTRELGFTLREFVKVVCPQYNVKDLPREEAARARRQANNIKKGTATTSKKTKKAQAASRSTTNNNADQAEGENVTKTLNLFTYKLHALGDYVEAIWKYGPSDNYTTQPGENEHIRSKKFYTRTNKATGFEEQIAKHYRRQNIIRRVDERLRRFVRELINPPTTSTSSTLPPPSTAGPSASPAEAAIPLTAQTPNTSATSQPVNTFSDEIQTVISPEQHYHLPVSKKKKINLFRWVHSNQGDPAFKDFITELKSHILTRLLRDEDNDTTYTQEELSHLEFASDSIYEHSILRVNYTSYDLRRAQDSINPRTHSDILTLSRDEDPSHPFSYARVIGAFHAEITYNGNKRPKITRPTRINFLWVRWFELDKDFQGGWTSKRLHRVHFVPCGSASDKSSFGFLDPGCVIRGIHLIPAFAHGTTTNYLPFNSTARNKEVKDIIGNEDYKYHYVNMFVDRDIFMRFLGGGIGHAATNELTQCLRPDFMTPPEASSDTPMEVSEPEDDGLEIDGIEVIGNPEDEEDEDQGSDVEDDELAGDEEEEDIITGGAGEEHDEYGIDGYAPL